MSRRSIFILFLLFSLVECQQLQWHMIADGLSFNAPTARRDAALGFDSSFLILYGGRDAGGMPLQDSYAFNTVIGQWERLDFANAPPARYGMASASAVGSGLYIFGGFGTQGSSSYYNPYMAYGSSGLPSYKQSPAVSNKKQRSVPVGKQNMNQMYPSGSGNYNSDDDRADENFHPLPDGWFLNYATKSWQNFQSFQNARGFGSAAASPFSIGGAPRIIYSMGKSRDWLHSIVESVDQPIMGLRQQGFGQPSIIMYDLSSYSPAYPHARYGHSTTLLTDNHLLLYGGCLSGYGKGGPCPSTDTWLLHIDRGHWERLWECPTTKTGAAMVTLPSYEMCAAMQQGIYMPNTGMNPGNEPPVAVLWGGRERNPSSIRTYPSPDDEVAVFSLSQKEWFLKRVAPSPTDSRYPTQREGAAYVAGCLQNMPGMFVFGGRSVTDGRLLSDLWFLQASSSSALSTPTGRSCIYPFSFYHLHGMFQFFAYGVFFPIGYILGILTLNNTPKRVLHIALQFLGVALAICGFSFGVHSVRAPERLHFRHAHGIIGIITFILTIIQLLIGIGNIILSMRRSSLKSEEFDPKKSTSKPHRTSVLAHVHHILGALILALGIVNISLGVFLGVLPLAVWIIWYIYMGFLVLIVIGMEIVGCLRGGKKGVSKKPIKIDEDKIKIGDTRKPLNRPYSGPPPLETLHDDDSMDRRPHRNEVERPLITNPRQPKPGNVSGSGNLPQYNRPSEHEYPIPPARARPSDSAGFDFYEGRAPGRQQNQNHLTRVRLE